MTGSTESDRGMRWLLISRPIIVTTILGTEIAVLRGEAIPLSPLYSLIALSWLLSFGYWLLLKIRLPQRLLIYLQISLDAFLVTAIVHFSGGVFSQFSLLYFLVIIASSIFLLARGGFFLATLSTLCYCLLLWSEYRGLIPEPMARALSFPEATVYYLLLRGFIHSLSFYLVAAMSGFLAERLYLRVEELEDVKLTTDDILQGMGTGVISIDRTGEIGYFNRAAQEILGVSGELARGRPLKEVLPERLGVMSELLLDALEKGIPRSRFETDILMEDGSKRPLGASTTRLVDREGKRRGALALFTDLTKIKATEERLRRADRMAAIGELSAGIAHEIRNPLASIRGSIELLSKGLNPSGEDRRLMELVLRETDRLNSFIENFLRFARESPSNLSKTDLVPLLDEVEELVRSHPNYTAKVTIVRKSTDGKTLASADREQISQVLLNLCLNSLVAMDWEGELTLSVKSRDDRVGVSVKDTGVGIPRDEITQIFEPFYSGKGNGAGLGLAIAQRIVGQHGGEIVVKSEVKAGTEFTVWLREAD